MRWGARVSIETKGLIVIIITTIISGAERENFIHQSKYTVPVS